MDLVPYSSGMLLIIDLTEIASSENHDHIKAMLDANGNELQ